MGYMTSHNYPQRELHPLILKPRFSRRGPDVSGAIDWILVWGFNNLCEDCDTSELITEEFAWHADLRRISL